MHKHPLTTHLFACALLVSVSACSGTPERAPASAPGPGTSSPAPSSPEAQTPAEIDADGLAAAMAAGSIHLVDVRTPGEFAGGRATGAINIPLQDLESRVSELEAWKGEPVYLICASGGRSAAAQELLTGQGFTQTINVSGGTSGWQRAGHPVEK